jgi:hypothetical protein
VADYSIYMILSHSTDKRRGQIRVYAGRATSKSKAIELAYDLLYEEGGGVDAVAVVDWASQDETFVYRIGCEDCDGLDKANHA